MIELVNEMMVAIAAKYGVINDAEQSATFNFGELTPFERKVVAAANDLNILGSMSDENSVLYEEQVTKTYNALNDLKLFLSVSYRYERMAA